MDTPTHQHGGASFSSTTLGQISQGSRRTWRVAGAQGWISPFFESLPSIEEKTLGPLLDLLANFLGLQRSWWKGAVSLFLFSLLDIEAHADQAQWTQMG